MWGYYPIPLIEVRISTDNLGAGRTAAELAVIGGNRTTAKIWKLISGILQIPK